MSAPLDDAEVGRAYAGAILDAIDRGGYASADALIESLDRREVAAALRCFMRAYVFAAGELDDEGLGDGDE